MEKYRELFKAYINDYKLVPEFSTIIIAFVLMIAAVISFYGLTEELADDDLKIYDDFIINHIVAMRGPIIGQIMLSATVIGNSIGYLLIIPILTIFFIIRKNWRLSLEITIVLLLSSGLNFILFKKAWLRNGIILLCVLITLLIGVSRIYLGVHYPSDILAGYVAGFGWLMFCILILNLITLSKIKLAEADILH